MRVTGRELRAVSEAEKKPDPTRQRMTAMMSTSKKASPWEFHYISS
jgi:hypothetical protein